MNSNSDTFENSKRLMGLMTSHQRQIFSYIHTLVPDRHDAEDILQETSMVICEKFHEFQPDSDFVAWACQIAWWRVRNARKNFAKSKLVFDDIVLAAIATTVLKAAPELDQRHQALDQCLQRLNPRDRELVLTRYERGCGVEEAAKRSGRTLTAAYKALGRIRKLLHDCVSLRLPAEAQ